MLTWPASSNINYRCIICILKQLNDIALTLNKSSQSYGVSLVIWDHLPPDTTELALPNPRLIFD